MPTRPLRMAAALAATALALGTSAVASGAQGAELAPGGSPLTLYTPDSVVAYAYEGHVYTDLGLRLVAPEEPFELWSTRASYDDPIQTEWRPGTGPAVPLPSGTMTDFTGLPDFLDIEIHRASNDRLVSSWTQAACLNGNSQRISPDAPARSPYPGSCPWNPYTLGSVMGIEAGHASSFGQAYERALRLRPGHYEVRSTIDPAYTELFGISPEDATGTTLLEVRRDPYSRPATRAPRSRVAQPAAQAPAGRSAGRADGPSPDLRSLPAWGITLNRKGTVLRFAATVWNAGDSPLVVDGFRTPGEDHMDAYQYFFDADGTQTGYQQVGQMHWHEANHQHWHFEDFAQYRLLNEDLSQAVMSKKQSFCLANTDAVDYTVDSADWHPENTDLSTACGGRDALSVRQVLASGSGDTYQQYRAGQAFRIKNLPNGVYYIAVEANPIRNLVESDETNNDALRRVKIAGKAGHRRITVAPVGIVAEDLPDWYGRR